MKAATFELRRISATTATLDRSLIELQIFFSPFIVSQTQGYDMGHAVVVGVALMSLADGVSSAVQFAFLAWQESESRGSTRPGRRMVNSPGKRKFG